MSGCIGNGNSPKDVSIQDQTTSTIILPMVQRIGSTTLTADTVEDAYSINVVSVVGMAAGQHLRIINAQADRYYFGAILSIAGLTVTLDTPLDLVYVAGSEVTFSRTNMNVNGAATPQVFTLRTGGPSIPSDVDITRIIFVCTCSGPVDLNKFGNLAALPRGLVFRRRDGDKINIFNVKSNRDIAGIAYDWTPFTASNPSQGIDGFSARLTFAGQNKIGVVLRIGPEENLEAWVQDNLTGLTSLSIILEGHVVQP